MKILINADSIRKNPDYAPGMRKFMRGPTQVTIGGRLATAEEIEKIKNDDYDDIKDDIEISCAAIDITTIDDPKYLYEYEDKQVQCRECDSIFDHLELEYDCEYDGAESNAVCPICEAWNCCDVEYEDIEEAIQRAGFG